eukprot:TRINITY_DN2393_c0_g1_i1.p1 TRINITY_DN2393_c0_g1~~TRINITY_DN2393_c0_g1_i1.p1  ORF type:complete len:687 (+),score=218.04 TRINITY_DN2393_c0_g1_i1:45-2105(+)
MFRRQLRRCTTRIAYQEELTKHERNLIKELQKKHQPEAIAEIKQQVRGIRAEKVRHHMYPGEEMVFGKVGKEGRFEPTTISLEEAEQAGLRDINEDTATYQIAVATLKERGMDVVSLFDTVGCPEPVLVLLHLLTLHKSKAITLTDWHVAAIIGRHADEMKLKAEPDPADVKKAFKMRDACLDAGVPFEKEAHTSLLRAACVGGDLDAACEVFQELVTFGEERHYGMVMTAAIRAGETEFALELFGEMKERKIPITEKSALVATSAFAAAGDYQAAEHLQQEYEGMGNVATVAMKREILRAHCNAGNIKKALELAEALEKGTISPSDLYPMLIHGASVAGDLQAGTQLLETAHRLGVLRLKDIHSLLDVCAAGGLVEQAFSLVNLILRLRMVSTQETGDLLAACVSSAPAVAHHDINEAWVWLTTQPWTPSSAAVSTIIEVSAHNGDPNSQTYLDTAKRRGIPIDDACMVSAMLKQAKAKVPLRLPLDIFKNLKTKTKEAWYSLSEVLCSTSDFGIALRLAKEVYPGLEQHVLGKGMVSGQSCSTLPQLVHYIRGLGKIHVLSDLDLLREHPEEVTDCCKLFIPFSLLAEEVLKDATGNGLYEIMGLPHAEVIRVPEQILAHAAIDAMEMGHLFDFTLKSHRAIAFASLLTTIGKPYNCKVVLLGRSGVGNKSDLASRVGVKVERL